jgi:MOSC domain-containing protein YiiM
VSSKISRELVDFVPQIGRLEWIGVRPGHREPMRSLTAVDALTDRGLEGDRATIRARGRRQVTLLQLEHLDVVARLMRMDAVDPALLRRNLVVSGIPVRALARRRFRIGDGCVLEGVGECFPCGRMEEALGDGGYSAMRAHGGIIARVHVGGSIAIGQPVVALPVERA